MTEILRWTIAGLLLVFASYVAFLNWWLLFDFIRNKMTGRKKRIASSVFCITDISLILASLISPEPLNNAPLVGKIWLLFVWLNPGSLLALVLMWAFYGCRKVFFNSDNKNSAQK